MLDVDQVIHFLTKLREKGYKKIIVQERTGCYDNDILSINPDDYEMKNNNDKIIKITVG